MNVAFARRFGAEPSPVVFEGLAPFRHSESKLNLWLLFDYVRQGQDASWRDHERRLPCKLPARSFACSEEGSSGTARPYVSAEEVYC